MDSSFKNLSIHEQIRLVEDLWDSIASDLYLYISSAQKAELGKRLEAYEVIKVRIIFFRTPILTEFNRNWCPNKSE